MKPKKFSLCFSNDTSAKVNVAKGEGLSQNQRVQNLSIRKMSQLSKYRKILKIHSKSCTLKLNMQINYNSTFQTQWNHQNMNLRSLIKNRENQKKQLQCLKRQNQAKPL